MTDDEKYKWPMRNKDIANLLGVTESHIRGLQRDHKKDLVEGEGYWGVPGKDLGVPNAPTLMTVWSKEGAIKLARHITTTEAAKFFEEMGEGKRHISSVESDSIGIITAAIDGHTRYKRHYPVGPYKVDLYLLDLKVAIECDEQGHKNRNKLMEEWRQKVIEEESKCQFIRFNPDETNFNVGNVINRIITLILEKGDK